MSWNRSVVIGDAYRHITTRFTAILLPANVSLVPG